MADARTKLRNAALAAVEKGDWKKAVECYAALEKAEPTDGVWAQRQGDACKKLGKGKDAVGAFARAVDAYAKAGLVVKAIAVCKLILELDPTHEVARKMVPQIQGAAAKGGPPPPPPRTTATQPKRDEPPPPPPRHQMPAQRQVVDLSGDDEPFVVEHSLSTEGPAPEAGVRGVPVIPAALELLELPRQVEVKAPIVLRPMKVPERPAAPRPPAARWVPPPPSDDDDDLILIDPDDPGGSLPQVPLGRLVPGAKPATGLDTPTGTSAMEIPIADFEAVPTLLDSDPEALVRDAFPKTPFFSALSDEHMKLLIERVTLVSLEPGEVVFAQGEIGDMLYVIASGEIAVCAPEEVARLQEGSFFGEIALLVDQPRSATMVATQATQLLAIDRALFGTLVQKAPELLSVVVKFVRDRLVQVLLETSPLFGAFPPDDRGPLVNRFKFLEVDGGLPVVEQGKLSPGLFVVLAGRASVVRDGETIATLGPGEVFGEISLMTRGPATASVVMGGRSFVLQLSRADFNDLIFTHPQILEYVNALAESRQTTPIVARVSVF